MKNQIKKRITKIATVVTLTAMVMGTCIGCGNSAKVENTESANAVTEDAKTELVTYEFETYDNVKIVIDKNSIITQEPSDDPQNSELIPAEAAGNVIAPGRDYVYFADDKNYYVADLSRNLVTVADKSKVQTAAAAELVTYEFETYDNVKVVIDKNSIITQEPSDDPQNSELIPAEAAGNVIAPGRDYVFFADDKNYYVVDLSKNLVTVADKSKVQTAEADSAAGENPGAFETASWSISYDTEKWYGFEDNGSVVINNLGAVAGSSYIEIAEVDVATVDEAITFIQDAKGKKLTAPEKVEKSGSECYVAYDDPAESAANGVAIFDFYLIFEHNGKVIIINESITQDDDESRAEALSYEFDDVINTFVLK